MKLIPGKRLALVFACTLPLLLLGDEARKSALALELSLLALAWIEARFVAKADLELERSVPTRLLLGAPNTITLSLYNRSARSLRGTLRDDAPDSFACEPSELAVELPPRARRTLEYRVSPKQRGRYTFGDLHVRLEGQLGLGSAIVRVAAAQETRVYPNLRGPRRYELAARLGALHSVGVRSLRKLGGGGELEQLREYVPGDSFHALDWKATAKRARPITRQYGQEQSQTVLVALDAGRMMAVQSGALCKLDHAINAALLLVWVALRSGDRVGLVIFADRVREFVPPARGLVQYRRILDALFAVEASPAYVDFRRLTEFVRVRLPRRALLVMFSDLLDESQAMPLAAEAPRLRGKHLPVCVTMNDPVAVALADAPAADADAVFQRAAAADILADREAVKTHLSKAGVGLVEAPAGELAVATVNRYLEIKTRHAL